MGFGSEAHEALVCTVACVEPAGAPAARSCEGLVAAAAPAGTWTDAPPPSLMARALVLAAEKPSVAAAVLVLLAVAVAAVVLARRPRPRP
jgi:hypothetical protein